MSLLDSMRYWVKGYDIVAYTFAADTYCPNCISGMFGDGTKNAEDTLDDAAAEIGIDRQAEDTFDSGDFPKVVFASSVEDIEHCGGCGKEI